MDECSQGSKSQLEREENALGRRDPWLVHVDVYLKSDDPDDPEFEVKSCLPTKKHEIDGEEEDYIVFENNGRPGFDIVFQLHDQSGPGGTDQGYGFARMADDAIWSRTGDHCPDETWSENPEYEDARVFDPKSVFGEGRKKLRVHFDNPQGSGGKGIGEFRYTLNVTKDNGGSYLHLDPGGTGSNGQDLHR